MDVAESFQQWGIEVEPPLVRDNDPELEAFILQLFCGVPNVFVDGGEIRHVTGATIQERKKDGRRKFDWGASNHR